MRYAKMIYAIMGKLSLLTYVAAMNGRLDERLYAAEVTS